MPSLEIEADRFPYTNAGTGHRTDVADKKAAATLLVPPTKQMREGLLLNPEPFTESKNAELVTAADGDKVEMAGASTKRKSPAMT